MLRPVHTANTLNPEIRTRRGTSSGGYVRGVSATRTARAGQPNRDALRLRHVTPLFGRLLSLARLCEPRENIHPKVSFDSIRGITLETFASRAGRAGENTGKEPATAPNWEVRNDATCCRRLR